MDWTDEMKSAAMADAKRVVELTAEIEGIKAAIDRSDMVLVNHYDPGQVALAFRPGRAPLSREDMAKVVSALKAIGDIVDRTLGIKP